MRERNLHAFTLARARGRRIGKIRHADETTQDYDAAKPLHLHAESVPDLGTLAAPETVTVIRARGRRLAKLIAPGGAVQGYDAARIFDLAEEPIADLHGLAALLRRLAHRRDCAAVRGAVADPARTNGVRRLLHRDAARGDGPTLREVPRRWLALDVDGLALPDGTDPRDLAACHRAVLPRLPSAFGGASVVVQATGSHAITPGARLRLWYWCDRALSGAECRRWLRGVPVDHSVFGAAQPIFTAAPVFAPGMVDHLPDRLLQLPGEPLVVAPSPAALAPPPRPTASPAPTATGGSRYALSALARAAARVASAPVGGRHDTAKREAWALARLVCVGLLTEAEVKRALGGAIEKAGKPAEEAEGIVAWAVARRSAAELPGALR